MSALPTQAQTLDFVRDRWPDRVSPEWRALKLGEEAGEVQGAVVKMAEGRKTLADVSQETAQLVICAMALAESAGFDLLHEVAREWERCGTRTWESGQPEAEAIPLGVYRLYADDLASEGLTLSGADRPPRVGSRVAVIRRSDHVRNYAIVTGVRRVFHDPRGSHWEIDLLRPDGDEEAWRETERAAREAALWAPDANMTERADRLRRERAEGCARGFHHDPDNSGLCISCGAPTDGDPRS